MLKSELLTAILNNYTAATALNDDTRLAVEQFCTYAADWLKQNNVVGMGRAAAGLSLRFGDGRELSLFDLSDIIAPSNQPAVSITGNIGGARPGVVAMTDSSFPITVTSTENL
jgi:hypothetical protein